MGLGGKAGGGRRLLHRCANSVSDPCLVGRRRRGMWRWNQQRPHRLREPLRRMGRRARAKEVGQQKACRENFQMRGMHEQPHQQGMRLRPKSRLQL